MSRSQDDTVEENQRIEEHQLLQEKLDATPAKANPDMEVVATQTTHTLPSVHVATSNAVKTFIPHAPPIRNFVPSVQNVTDQTMRVVRRSVNPAIEVMSNSENREHIEHALHVADRIIDDASRPYTGGIPVYRYTKKAIITANETISENRKNKTIIDETIVQEETDHHTIMQEVADHTMKLVHHAATSTADAMSTPEGRKKLGHDALCVADHIIDEGSRPYTGGLPVYKYTKEAIIVANETITEHRKNQTTDQTIMQEVTDHTMRIVRHAATSTTEAMSTPEGRKKVGHDALYIADHIIDEASRPYTGGIPVYRYTKEAVVSANKTISENRKQNATEQKMVHEESNPTTTIIDQVVVPATGGVLTSESNDKIGHDVLHIAYHIIDEATKSDTGEMPIYQYTKEAIIIANDAIIENQKTKLVDEKVMKETSDQSTKGFCHTITSTTEAISTIEGWKKIERDALKVADHIVDEGSRSYTGGVPIYQYTKNAMVVANETISTNKKKKAIDQTIVQEPVDQTMVQEAPKKKTSVDCDATIPIVQITSAARYHNWACCVTCVTCCK